MKILCSWYWEEREIMVVLFRHPGPIEEAVTPNADGTHTIFINADLCDEKRERALKHALWHISHGDFWSEKTIGQIEREARGGYDVAV